MGHGRHRRTWIKAVAERPQMELVGLWVHSDSKVGRDAGELAGLGRDLGVKATHDLEAIVALKPDCVIYMPQYCNLDEVCRLLESGANIVTSVVSSTDRRASMPQVRERIEAACAKGRDLDPLDRQQPGLQHRGAAARVAVAGAESRRAADRRVRRHDLAEFAGSAVQHHGFRQRPGEFDARASATSPRASVRRSRRSADAFGLPLDSVEPGGDFAVATHGCRDRRRHGEGRDGRRATAAASTASVTASR